MVLVCSGYLGYPTYKIDHQDINLLLMKMVLKIHNTEGNLYITMLSSVQNIKLVLQIIKKMSGQWVRVRVMVFNATFNNISDISWQSVLLVNETRVSGENHPPAASH